MNKNYVAGLVERLQKHIFYGDARLFNFKKHSPLAMEAADALTTLSARVEALEAALRDLAEKEAEYRYDHDVYGDSNIMTGHAWDRMRHSGDRARQALAGDDHGHR